MVDDDRLAGLWVRHTSSEAIDDAPVRLPDGAFGLAHAELRTVAGHTRRTIVWLRFDRSGVRAAGSPGARRALPAVASWQALAHVERALGERGVRLNASDQAKTSTGMARGWRLRRFDRADRSDPVTALKECGMKECGMVCSDTTGRQQTSSLHRRVTQLRNGKEQRSAFFSKTPEDGLDELPTGYEVVEVQASGLPVLKKTATGSPA
jgi:hypothetical protein